VWLVVGDLHLTDNPRDAYRFDIFPWLAKQQQRLKPVAIFLAGDVTDAKNKHSATLVNKVIDGLRSLAPPVYVCMGNHDYRDPDNPFFKFINHIEGLSFIHSPTIVGGVGVLPHYRSEERFKDGLRSLRRAKALLVHQTFEGAIAETGAHLSGFSAAPIESLKPPLGVYAGDVHMPQRSGIITYVGCPYHVRFGDDYTPRVLYVGEGGRRTNLFFDAPFKWNLHIRHVDDVLYNNRLCEGDQVKLTVQLDAEEALEWKRIKSEILAACAQLKVNVYGCRLEVLRQAQTTKSFQSCSTPEDRLRTFGKHEGIAQKVLEVGLQLSKDTGDKNGN
jgi:Calcineurin-like phosphoesterase